MPAATVYMRDLRKLKYCSRGARVFFVKHGLSWRDFLKNGIPAKDLDATGDAMAIKLAGMAHGRK